MNPLRWPLHWQILIALTLAAATGLIISLGGFSGTPTASTIVEVSDFFGTLFMNALKMIVVPLVVTSIICGMLAMGGDRSFARMGLKTLAYYTLSGLVAILIGLAVVNVMRPGIVSPELANLITGQAQDPTEFLHKVEGKGAADFFGLFLRMVPTNVFDAATNNGQLLGLITFSILFGFFVTRLPEKLRTTQEGFWQSSQAVIMGITDLVIKFAPIGVFGLVTPIFIRTGFELFVPLLWFFLTVLLALGLHFFVGLGLMLRFLGKTSPAQHYKAMTPVLLTAFSTASSASTLPLTMETVEKSAGVSNRTASFTLPLGATVNMDGTALYECVVVIFIAQIYSVIQGYDLTFLTQLNVVVLALMTSIGVAGIPAASLVAITVILGAVGLPIEAIGLVWVTDRILDMCRTSVNVFSDTVGAVIIARSEGENVYPLPTSD
jgi:proton glutamate symport protein